MSKELLLSKGTMIVSETDEKGNILYVNKDFCEYAGYDKLELIGRPHNIIRHPDMPKEAFKNLWQTINSGQVWRGIVKNRTKSGDYYWVLATIFTKICENGQKKHISVRQKATDQEIEEAKTLYLTLK